ncbi:NAD(+)/NADH kinase [bacterium]|nr:NAD(+)/NADH kinase [bacterium]
MNIGIVGNLDKPHFHDVLPPFLDEVRARGASVIMDPDAARVLGLKDSIDVMPAEDIPKNANLMLSFGGDGTLLSTARLVGPHEKPILGINLGGLGYLTEVPYDNLIERIEDILASRYDIQERMMLCAQMEGDEGFPHVALNDFVLERSGTPRMTHLETTIDGKHLTMYKSDGLIVATPTGSTGYNLSASGPILEPTMKAIIVTPICPHSLSMRPLVIDADRTVEIRPTSDSAQVRVVADGQRSMVLETGKAVRIRCAPFVCRLAVFSGRVFYNTLAQKLRWGQR